MKYIISRTSEWGVERKPAPEAKKVETVHYYSYFRQEYENLSSWAKDNHRDFKEVNGRLRAVYKKGREVWVGEVDDINAFVDRNGECVIFPIRCEEGYREIEIYDTYRE